jgi:hypothetical protein
MNFARNKQQEEICHNIDFNNFKEKTKSILLINEPFGTGKTHFINNLINKIEKEKIVDILITFQNEEKASFFTEVFAGTNIRFVSHSDQSVLSFNETNFNFNQFNEILNDLKKTNTELFLRLTNFLILKSSSQYFSFQNSHKPDNEKDILIEAISEFIPQKGIQRLIFESGRVVIESFIVDLLNTFYPIKDSNTHLEDFVGKVQKPNITLILDDYESIGYCINKWLIHDFFYYAFKAKLEEFITYDLKGISGDLKVADFFDFNFVISTREKLQSVEKYNDIHHYEDIIHRIDFPSLTKPEILDFIYKSQINTAENQFPFDKFSKGNLFLLNLLVEQYRKSNQDPDLNFVINKASDLILEFQSSEHKEWIKAACHLEIVEEQGLRCFQHIGSDFRLVYEYIKSCSDILVESSLAKGIIEIDPIVKEFLRKSLKIDSIQTSIEYENIVKSYNDIKETLKRLKYEELEAVRDLTYFRKINLDITTERDIANNLEIVKKLKENYPEWFISNKHSVSLSANVLSDLKKFNLMIDFENKKSKEEKSKKLWEDYSDYLKSELVETDKQISTLSLQSKDINKGVVTNKQQYEDHQRGIMEKENKLIELKKRLSTFSTTKPLTAALTNIGLALLVIIISYVFPKIFENIENENSILAIQIILYLLAAIFFGFSGIFIYKLIQIYKSNSIITELTLYIQKTEEERALQQEEMRRINQEKEMIPRKIDDIGMQIANLRDKTKILNEKLNDIFI